MGRLWKTLNRLYILHTHSIDCSKENGSKSRLIAQSGLIADLQPREMKREREREREKKEWAAAGILGFSFLI